MIKYIEEFIGYIQLNESEGNEQEDKGENVLLESFLSLTAILLFAYLFAIFFSKMLNYYC